MSPAAQGNLDVEQYVENCLITQSAKVPKNNINCLKQNSRQFHNSQNRNHYQNDHQHFGKNTFTGARTQKFNIGYAPRQINYGETNHGWANAPLSSSIVPNQRRYQLYPMNNQYNTKQRNVNEGSKVFLYNQSPAVQNGARFNGAQNKPHFSNKNNQKLYRNNKSEKQNQSKDTPNRTSDTNSNVSDESSGNSENSLPRIIKPRKRRKKDRKPLVESTETNPAVAVVETQNTSKPIKLPQMKSPIIPIKLFTPQSYEQPKPKIIIQQRNDFKMVPSRPIEHDMDIKTNTTEESIFSPLVTDSFVNLLLDEGKHNGAIQRPLTKSLDKLVASKKDEEPSTVCQCRYCDPSGEIWDVDQRCYSPFLTPPSPNEPKLFINSIRPVVPGQYSRGNVSSYLLRRSWSEPSSESSLVSNISRPRNKSDSFEANSNDLQVSSEIVTSPNGHRDIEIKFFSPSKRYLELNKSPSYSPNMYLSSPPISPWKKEVRFGDLFLQPSEIRSSMNVIV